MSFRYETLNRHQSQCERRPLSAKCVWTTFKRFKQHTKHHSHQSRVALRALVCVCVQRTIFTNLFLHDIVMWALVVNVCSLCFEHEHWTMLLIMSVVYIKRKKYILRQQKPPVHLPWYRMTLAMTRCSHIYFCLSRVHARLLHYYFFLSRSYYYFRCSWWYAERECEWHDYAYMWCVSDLLVCVRIRDVLFNIKPTTHANVCVLLVYVAGIMESSLFFNAFRCSSV